MSVVGDRPTVVDQAREAMPYRTLLTLARGGMGQVDLCVRRSGSFERLYAIKRLHPHLREEETMRSMFLDEARVAGLVRHANVVSVLDVGEDAEGPFLVMDYVEGVSLSRFLQARARSGEPVPIPVIAEIVAQVARGLHAAHELTSTQGTPLGLVHRDVSPQNILVGRDGVVRVTDFGIAKALGRSTHTSTGVLKGKLGYMSPEQLRFERVDRRTDLFSLGVVLYELIHLRRLYQSDESADTARRILRDDPPDLGEHRPDVPPALVELAFELLAKQPEHRPKTALDVAERLEELTAAYGEVVDIGQEMEAGFGQELDAQAERIRALVEADEPTRSSATLSSSRFEPGPAPTSRRWSTLGLVTAAIAGVTLLVWAPRWLSSEPPSAPEPSPPVASETVTLRVESEPPDATIELGPTVMGHTPTSFDLKRGAEPLVVLLKHEGYAPAEHRIIPDRDQTVFVALTPEPKAEPAPTRPEEPSTTRIRPASAKARRRPRTTAPDSKQPEPRPQFRKFE